MAYDRYRGVRSNGIVGFPPAVRLTEKGTDYTTTYTRGVTHLDDLSYDYYGDCSYAWLILMANPQYGASEFEIPDGSELRIPYPLDRTLENLTALTEAYFTLNGKE